MNFSKDYIKQIFSLACEGRHLKEHIVREFVRLSSQEVLFHTQAQSTSHESLAHRHLDHFTTYYKILWSDQQSSEAKDKAMEEILNKVSEAWVETNVALFKHVLDYDAKLDAFLNKSGGWIREQEERIWMKMFELMGEAGAPLCASLNIMLHLLDTLPLFPANLSYQSNSPTICGSAPEAYAQPWLGLHSIDLACLPSFHSCRKATDVLREAIIQSTGGGEVSTARAGPSASTSTAPSQIKKDAGAPPLPSSSAVHSPPKCRHAQSPSPQCSQSGSSSDEDLASERGSKGSRSSSSSSSVSSSGPSSGSGSHEGSPARSEASAGARSAHSQTASIASVEVLSGDEASGGDDEDASYSTNEADVSQGSMSLLDISISDEEDTHKRKVHELARKSDTNFMAWKDKLISDGVTGLQERDNMVNDYADSRKRRPKNSDPFVPPVSYMEDRGVFKPLASTTNPLGLWCFYPTDTMITSTLTPLKPPAKTDHVKSLLLLAKTQPRPYITVVFQGGAITALGLLQELHTQSALARIPIYQPKETKDGHRPHISCCPFCIPSRMIPHNWTTLSVALQHEFCMWDLSQCCNSILSANEEAHWQMQRVGPSCPANVAGIYCTPNSLTGGCVCWSLT